MADKADTDTKVVDEHGGSGDDNSAGAGSGEGWDDEAASSYTSQMEGMMKIFNQFRFGTSNSEEEKPKPEQLLEEVTFEGVAKYIKSDRCENILVLTGAGISTAAGIPDFRSPGTGLYHNLQKYDLPTPESIFELGYFRSNPEPFYTLAKELYPGSFKPTISHYFIKLLESKDLLLRNYTQNIDTLERIAGIPEDYLVEAHGTFHSAHCLECGKEFTQEWIRDEVFADRIPKCLDCEGLVKPDIVFFGEALPGRFHRMVPQDMPQCDLVIVMGTALAVQPFASLIDRVPETTPRLLINKEKSGQQPDFMSRLMGMSSGFKFDDDDNYRDVAWLGTSDEGCLALADLLGWKDELLAIVKEGHKKLAKEEAKQPKATSSSRSKATTNPSLPKHSPKTSPSAEQSPKTSPSAKPSPKASPSPKQSPKASPSAKQSPKKSPSPEHSPKKSPSPEHSPKKSPSPEHSPKRSPSAKQSPKKSPSAKQSPKKSSSAEQSPKKSPSAEQSPKKSPSAKQSTKTSPSAKS